MMRNSDAAADHTQVAIEATNRLLERVAGGPLTPSQAAQLTAVLDAQLRSAVQMSGGPLLAVDTRSWAVDLSDNEGQPFGVDSNQRDVPMTKADATAEPRITKGDIGIDLVRVSAGSGFVSNADPSGTFFVIVAGEGTLAYDGYVYPTSAGTTYEITGGVPHAVGSASDQVIMISSAPQRNGGSPDTEAVPRYEALTDSRGMLTCRICDLTAILPTRLADFECPHCPSHIIALHPPRGRDCE